MLCKGLTNIIVWQKQYVQLLLELMKMDKIRKKDVKRRGKVVELKGQIRESR